MRTYPNEGYVRCLAQAVIQRAVCFLCGKQTDRDKAGEISRFAGIEKDVCLRCVVLCADRRKVFAMVRSINEDLPWRGEQCRCMPDSEKKGEIMHNFSDFGKVVDFLLRSCYN